MRPVNHKQYDSGQNQRTTKKNKQQRQTLHRQTSPIHKSHTQFPIYAF
jgi:hypothetical protein